MREKLKDLNPEAYEILCKTYAGELETDSETLQHKHKEKYAHLRIAASWNLFDQLKSNDFQDKIMTEIGVYLAMFIGRAKPYSCFSINQNIKKHKMWFLYESETSNNYRNAFGINRSLVNSSLHDAYISGCKTAIDLDYKMLLLIEKHNLFIVHVEKCRKKYEEALSESEQMQKDILALKKQHDIQTNTNIQILASSNKKSSFNNMIARWRVTR